MRNNNCKAIKRWGSRLISFIFALIIIELFFIFTYYLLDGQYIPADKKIKSSAPKTFHTLSRIGCNNKTSLSPHPYLGFTQLAKPYCTEYSEGSSHTGRVFPAEKDSSKFTILFTGASVPNSLLSKAKPSFQKLLTDNFHYQNKEIVVLDGAINAWKQPQQLILLLLSLDIIDAVITLEGFNELTLNRQAQPKYLFNAPLPKPYQKANLDTLSMKQIALMKTTEISYKSVMVGHVLRHSKTIAFMLNTLKNTTKKALWSSEKTPIFQQSMSPFYFPESWTQQKRKDSLVQDYLRYVENMHQMATTNNIKFAYFLQPVPLIGKPLTAGEAERVKNKNYRNDYLKLESQLLALKKQNIDINSLINVFSDFHEEAYKDTIHLNMNSDAPQILSEAIIDVLVRHWGLEPIK